MLRQQSDTLARRLERASADLQEIRNASRATKARSDVLCASALARLRARLETMPVIEQAKGILMERQGCDAGFAFELLHQASMRSNTKLHVLAEELVRQAATRENGRYISPTWPDGDRRRP